MHARFVSTKQLLRGTSPGILSLTVLLLAAPCTIAPPARVPTDNVATNCHSDDAIMPWDISTTSIPAQEPARSQDSIKCNQNTPNGNNVTIRTKIKASHRVDVWMDGFHALRNIRAPLTCELWTSVKSERPALLVSWQDPPCQFHHQYGPVKRWWFLTGGNTEQSNFASELRLRKSRPTTTGGKWHLESRILIVIAGSPSTALHKRSEVGGRSTIGAYTSFFLFLFLNRILFISCRRLYI